MLQKNDLIKFFELKGLKYDEVKIGIWNDYLKDYSREKILKALNKIILNTSIINPGAGHVLEIINESEEEKTEKIWNEVLLSAKYSGTKKISARAAKVLNSMGGMYWLRDADISQVNWQRKEFMEIYKNTPEPNNTDFNCPGLSGTIYLENNNQKLLQ